MKRSNALRPLILIAVCAVVMLLGQARPVYAQQELMSVDQLEMKMKQEGLGRGLSQATEEELMNLRESGGGMTGNLFNPKYVFKVGRSTFILSMPPVTLIALVAFVTIFFFFTPLGLAFFRGSLHNLVGSILASIPFTVDFGKRVREVDTYFKKEKNVRKAFKYYMHNDFIPNYKNNITAIAFMGTAFLIFSIGVRGIKFLVAHQPTMIICAIGIEVTVLLLLGLTTWYEKEEDEDANAGDGLPNKQLSLADVERRLDALKSELEQSVNRESNMYPKSH
jgi:hypothetical protein